MPVWEDARRGRWATRGALLGAALLASGCMQVAAPHGGSPRSPKLEAMLARQIGTPPAPDADADTFDLEKPELEKYVVSFQTRSRGFFDRALARANRYFVMMSGILAREGLPIELAYLPLIESGYQPHAVSPAGATGPWQFIRSTAQRYGLRVDALVDERRDPVKSTEAAVRYLKDLHDMFGDWELSLAAYNVGEDRVARILARKDVDDFWDMRRGGYLPRETSEYVPRFLAAVRIAQAPESYGFEAPIPMQIHFETVRVDRDLPLEAAARMSGVTQAELKVLNPALRRGVSPRGYQLRVPIGSAAPLRQALTERPPPAPARHRTGRGRRRAGGHDAVVPASTKRPLVRRTTRRKI
jgi:peptidoglycan lytic transglycosylase D